MSYLTTPAGPAPAATGTGPLGIGAPGFAHPLLAPTEWAELLRLARGLTQDRGAAGGAPRGAAGRAPRGAAGAPVAGGTAGESPPGVLPPLHWAVLNVARGPGSRPDPYCLPAAAQLRDAGVRLLGHLDVRHGSRPLGELTDDARRFLEWYKADGFWLDRCPTDRTGVSGMRRLSEVLRALTDGGYLVGDHGVPPHPDYVTTADQLVTFRGPWSAYRRSRAPEWTAGHPPERFCHLVHGLPRAHLEEALDIAREQRAGTVCFTDRTDREGDAWESLPGHWDAFVSHIGPGVSE
ncbi:spherulation-specific family 4 protein [Streptomyces sp. MST-110588]|uniref:spherulation-specific family 4 protein n=1 Tax=Streptomyces sp. MST-110588 TaxID=2833628 RepID=UPI001F5CD8C0|nr:spherulation-specific family 4 protein [Streptomyces sp. MST-110588]UNO40046.1 phage tail protein [Streptomyces sp. MST-110588]